MTACSIGIETSTFCSSSSSVPLPIWTNTGWEGTQLMTGSYNPCAISGATKDVVANEGKMGNGNFINWSSEFGSKSASSVINYTNRAALLFNGESGGGTATFIMVPNSQISDLGDFSYDNQMESATIDNQVFDSQRFLGTIVDTNNNFFNNLRFVADNSTGSCASQQYTLLNAVSVTSSDPYLTIGGLSSANLFQELFLIQCVSANTVLTNLLDPSGKFRLVTQALDAQSFWSSYLTPQTCSVALQNYCNFDTEANSTFCIDLLNSTAYYPPTSTQSGATILGSVLSSYCTENNGENWGEAACQAYASSTTNCTVCNNSSNGVATFCKDTNNQTLYPEFCSCFIAPTINTSGMTASFIQMLQQAIQANPQCFNNCDVSGGFKPLNQLSTSCNYSFLSCVQTATVTVPGQSGSVSLNQSANCNQYNSSSTTNNNTPPPTTTTPPTTTNPTTPLPTTTTTSLLSNIYVQIGIAAGCAVGAFILAKLYFNSRKKNQLLEAIATKEGLPSS